MELHRRQLSRNDVEAPTITGAVGSPVNPIAIK
jgi:hypothetical protein